MIKKSQFTSYMIDCKGYDKEEADELWADNGGCVEECLSHSEVEELIEYAE